MGFIEGQPRPPAKYTPQRAVELEAGKAAAETADLAKYRAVQEKTHTNISESMLLNTVGETGASLGKFLDRPSIQQAIRKARLAAKETGTYWPKTPDEPFTVGNLQRIKREVADTVAEAAKQGRIGKTTKAERTATVSEFTDWLRSKSSDFAKAEDMFAENIQPINRMKFGQELMKRMSDNLDVKERPMAFANAIENAEKLIKDQTGRAMPLDEFLLPEQMKQIEQMKMQYARDAKLNTMSSGGMKKLNEVVGTVFDLPTVGILERTIVIINSIVKRLEGRNTTEALNRMAELGLQPKELARLMKAANKEERAFLEKHMNAKTKATVASMIASETTGEQE